MPTVSKQYRVVAGNQNWTTTAYGVTPEYMAIKSLTVGSGSFISLQDINARNRVTVLGVTVAENFFGEINPTGKNIQIDNKPYQVIGVLNSKGRQVWVQAKMTCLLFP